MDSSFKDRANALASIHGFFSPASHGIWDVLLRLQSDHGIGGHLVEIGVFHGKSAMVLAPFRGGDELVALVDPRLRRDSIARAFSAVGIDLNEEHHLLLENRSSELSAAHDFWDLQNHVRFLHVDGAHTAADVYRDLSLADRLMSDAGICVVDDFFNFSYPQITEAVYEFLVRNPHSFRLFLAGSLKCYLCRPGSFFDYYTFCYSHLRDELMAREIYVDLKKTSGIADSHTLSVIDIASEYPYWGPDWERDRLETLGKESRGPTPPSPD